MIQPIITLQVHSSLQQSQQINQPIVIVIDQTSVQSIQQSNILQHPSNHTPKNTLIASTILRSCYTSFPSLLYTLLFAAALSFAQNTSMFGFWALVLQELMDEAGKQTVRVERSWVLSWVQKWGEYWSMMQWCWLDIILASEPPILLLSIIFEYYQLLFKSNRRQMRRLDAQLVQIINNNQFRNKDQPTRTSLIYLYRQQCIPRQQFEFASKQLLQQMYSPNTNLHSLLLLILIFPLSTQIIIARLLTIDDSLKISFKLKFKFTDVFTTQSTRSFITNHTHFEAIDQIPSLAITNLGRIQKAYHKFGAVTIYAFSHLLDQTEAQSWIKDANQKYQASAQMFVVEQRAREMLGEIKGNNLCWVNKQNLYGLSYQAVHQIIAACLQKQLHTTNQSAEYQHQHPTSPEAKQQSILEQLWLILLGWVGILGLSATKLYLVKWKTRSQSVV